jgi:CDP-2,3-bis-(O-geranylgeranyl)-sn-glycerol synthase
MISDQFFVGMNVLNAATALLLVCVASSAAWAVSRALGKRFAAPLDFGLELADGKRLFGSHKTWRGLAGGTLACALVAPLVGLGAATGAAFGALALLGDALSSAVKRRLALPPGVETLGLDQLPEALLPLMVFAAPLGLGAIDVAVVALVFMVLDILVKPLRHRL